MGWHLQIQMVMETNWQREKPTATMMVKEKPRQTERPIPTHLVIYFQKPKD